MQESWKFINLKAPESREKSLIPWLNNVMDQNDSEMGIFLSYYYRREGAVVENVRLKPPSSDLTEMTGSITVTFELVHFNACLNIHDTNPEQLILFYEISDQGTALTLTGPYWPEREPDEL
ncbi:hypothetical protein [Lunatibacter salilacus]|uniref:hypothetical protein n=1 Tax=Lunatibacter salilacus TaxID=2483804 RepID=UPI00131D67BA|nr:hypothetical protein [Lunatibacter salilacus]